MAMLDSYDYCHSRVHINLPINYFFFHNQHNYFNIQRVFDAFDSKLKFVLSTLFFVDNYCDSRVHIDLQMNDFFTYNIFSQATYLF